MGGRLRGSGTAGRIGKGMVYQGKERLPASYVRKVDNVITDGMGGR